MKQWKKGIVTTALVMGLVMPIGAQAQNVQAQPLSKPGAVTSIPEQESQDHHGHHKFKMRMSVHQKMYMTLLAEKYTPKQAAEWQSVFKERERLIGELKAARKTSSPEGKMDKQAKSESEDAERRAHMEKARHVYGEFHAAIESGEEAKIKEVLPKLLEQMKAKNERLAKKVAEAKK
ncbi:hypothetical protein ACQKK5_20930 [Brevibacillus panacihumi]|uniref:hypothetical protein n=1 Tax=Brevibacillus panacihumi TaxID=497735 RepID=UPI003D01A1EF